MGFKQVGEGAWRSFADRSLELKKKLLLQNEFDLWVQLKESTSTYGRLHSVLNWKYCEIVWNNPTPTQKTFIDSMTTKDGVLISKLNIFVPDKYLNEDMALTSSFQSPPKPTTKKRPTSSQSSSQLSPGKSFRDALIVDDVVNEEKHGDAGVQSTGELGDNVIDEKEDQEDGDAGVQSPGELGGNAIDKKEGQEDGDAGEQSSGEHGGKAINKNEGKSDEEDGREDERDIEEGDEEEEDERKSDEGDGRVDKRDIEEGDEEEEDERKSDEGDGRVDKRDVEEGDEEEEDVSEEGIRDVSEEGEKEDERKKWLLETLSNDEEEANEKLHDLLGYPDAHSGILPRLPCPDTLGPYADDYIAFRDDLERLYGDGFLVSIWIKTINKSFKLDLKSDPASHPVSKKRRELTTTSNGRLWDNLGDPNDVTSVEFADRFNKLFPLTRNGKFIFNKNEFILGNWTIVTFYKRVKEEYIDDYTEGNGPGSELYQTVTNLLDKLSIDMSLGRNLLSIDWNGETLPSSTDRPQSNTTSRKKDEETPEGTISSNKLCSERCLGRCSDSSSSCMFLSNLLPSVQDEVGSNYHQQVREGFRMKPDIVFMGEQIFIPLVATNKKQSFWITTSRPEYIYTERVGCDVMTWQEGNDIKCIFAGQLYRSKVRGNGMVMVTKILRGKCRDNKIRLLIAEYEAGKGFVSRYVKGSQSHIDFLNKHTPTDHFASSEVITSCLLQYHERTSALFLAFDTMGGFVETDPRWSSYRPVSRKVHLGDASLRELLGTAFPEEVEGKWGQGLHIDDLVSCTLLAPHQCSANIAKLALTRQKNNSALNVNSGEVVGVNSMKDGFLYGLDCFDLHKVAPTTQKEAIRWCASTPPPFVVNVEKAIRSGVPGTKRSTNPIASKRKSYVGTDDKENSSNCASEISGETDDVVDVPKNNSTKPKRTNTKVSSTKRTGTLGGAKKTGKSATKSTSRAKDTSTKSSATVKNATKANGGRGRIELYESDSDSDVSTSNTQKASSGGTGFGATVGGNGVSKRSSNVNTGKSAATKSTSRAKDTSTRSSATVKNATKANGGRGRIELYESDSDSDVSTSNTQKASSGGTGFGATVGGNGASERSSNAELGKKRGVRDRDDFDLDDFVGNNENMDCNRPKSSGIIDEFRKKTKEIEDKKLQRDMREGIALVAAVRATFGNADAKEYEKYLKANASEIGRRATSAGGASDYRVSTQDQNHDQGSSGIIDKLRKKTKEIEDKKLQSDMWEGIASVAAVRATFGDADAKEYEKYLKASASQAERERVKQEMSEGVATRSEVTEFLGEDCAEVYSRQFRNLSKLDRRSLYKDRLSNQRDGRNSDERSRSREGDALRASSRDRNRRCNIDDNRGRHESYWNDSRREWRDNRDNENRRDYENRVYDKRYDYDKDSRSCDNRRDYDSRSNDGRREYDSRSNDSRREYDSRSNDSRREYDSRSNDGRRDYHSRSYDDRRDCDSLHSHSSVLEHAKALAYLKHSSTMDKLAYSYR